MTSMLLVRGRRPTRPTEWTGDLVLQRLKEAFEVQRRVPEGKRWSGGVSAWPVAVVHEFTDVVGWDDTRQRVWDDWKQAKGAYPYEISRMDEAMDWFRILKDYDGERTALLGWALATANNRSVRREMRKHKLSRSTFYRRVNDGAKRIAQQLKQAGVQVR